MRVNAYVVSLVLVSFACLSLLVRADTASNGAPTSTWVFYDPSERLQYQEDPDGNHIMDYSQAGYGGGGVAIPDVPTRFSITPSGGDDTAAIQQALLNVGSLTSDANGFRGALLLEPGTFTVSSQIYLNISGVVLRGSGSGPGGTLLSMTGPQFPLFIVGGSGAPTLSNTVDMVTTYVPAGSKSFNVTSTAGFQVGDTVYVHRPVTDAWIHLLGMDQLVLKGVPQTWLPAGSEILTDRIIGSIIGNRITLDVPLTDSWDPQFLSPPGGSLSKYTFPGRISKVGVEDLAINAPGDVQTTDFYEAFVVDIVVDAWLRNIRIQDTQNSVNINEHAKRVTLDNVQVVHTYRSPSSHAPADFAFVGTQILANNCSVVGKGNTWPFVTQLRATGPIVLLKCFADDRGFAPHLRWATGLLCDASNFPSTYDSDKTGIAYTNRGNFGSGQGWSSGWSVAWNVVATTLCVEQPPGSLNWAIGCQGKQVTKAAPGGNGSLVPDGIYESLGTAVTPGSLYLAQLKERKGVAGLNAIGYADENGTPFERPSVVSSGSGSSTSTQTSGASTVARLMCGHIACLVPALIAGFLYD